MTLSRFTRRLLWLSPGICLVAFSALPALPAQGVSQRIIKITNLKMPMLRLKRDQDDLVQKGSVAIQPLLEAALSQKDARVKIRLLHTLHRIQVENPGVRIQTGNLKLLKKLLDEEKDYVARYWVVKVCGLVKSEEMAIRLNKILDEPDERGLLHIETVLAIGMTGHGDKLLASHHRSPNYRLREAVCEALAPYKTKSSLSCLFAGLHDTDIRVRSAAIDSLKEINNSNRLGFDAQGVEKRRNNSLKRWFQWIRKDAGLKFSPAELAPFITAPVVEIRRQVCAANTVSRKAESLLVLLRGLEDQDLSVRQAALSSLKATNRGKDLGYKPADEKKQRDWAAVAWLKWVTAKSGVPGLKRADWLPLYEVASPKVRKPILEYLNGVKTKRAVRCTVLGLRDDSVEVRKVALKNIETLAGKKFDFDPKSPKDLLKKNLAGINTWLKEHRKSFRGP